MTFEDNSMRALNEKYLKKFIRKFWLQPIPETCDERFSTAATTDDLLAEDCPQRPSMFAGASSTGAECNPAMMQYSSSEDDLDDDNKYNSVEDGLNQMSSSSSTNLAGKSCSAANLAPKSNSPSKRGQSMSSSSTASSSNTSNSNNSRPHYKSHRRQPSYSNVDLIFLQVRK
eukprot:TRINITY_DN32238_c0_g1_i1.p1 TRINITY_DN32238_c0_g1~~TRINITY_DN32238_c0_g1_i1.p1  ORF type:complete len:172 (+),score=41.06 TRINITY_DN32238_c0_g1_i1:75-590(+)